MSRKTRLKKNDFNAALYRVELTGADIAIVAKAFGCVVENKRLSPVGIDRLYFTMRKFYMAAGLDSLNS